MFYFLALSCGTPPTVADATYDDTDGTVVDDIAIYACDPGYDMTAGGPNLTCTPTGALTVDWLPAPPMCNSKCIAGCILFHLRDDIKIEGKFAIISSFKIRGREGV